MTAKEFLSLYKQTDRRVEAKIDQLNRLHARVTLTSVAYSDMPKGGGQCDWTDIVDKYLAIESELKSELDELMRIRELVVTAIKNVESESQRTILEMRYLNGWSWPKIMASTHYQENRTYQTHRLALRAVKVPSDI